MPTPILNDRIENLEDQGLRSAKGEKMEEKNGPLKLMRLKYAILIPYQCYLDFF